VKGAPFRAIGGAVVADHGSIPLAEARRLSQFYATEALHCHGQGLRNGAAVCASRAKALREAVAAAELWRRAAGWADPDAADAPFIPGPGGRRAPHAAPLPHWREGR
jgi:hypothetical protein